MSAHENKKKYDWRTVNTITKVSQGMASFPKVFQSVLEISANMDYQVVD